MSRLYSTHTENKFDSTSDYHLGYLNIFDCNFDCASATYILAQN